MSYVYQEPDGKKIINFPTKDHCKSPSKFSYVTEGLDWICENYQKYQIDSIAYPPLGCGNGGLTWKAIGPVMYQKLSQFSIPVEIYAPYGTPLSELSQNFLIKETVAKESTGQKAKTVNPKWCLILQAVLELTSGKYTLVGRTIYQAMCYAITRNGIETGFQFTKTSYGPFSKQVKDSINILANANMIEEKQLGRMMPLCNPKDVRIGKEIFAVDEWVAMKNTVNLFSHVKSTEQAEMITCVLYAYDQLNHGFSSDVSDAGVYNYITDWRPQWKANRGKELCTVIQYVAELSQIQISAAAA